LSENGKDRTGEVAAPAIVVQVQTGGNMSMQFAVPLNMTPKDLNAYIDKVVGCMDRQGLIIQLKQKKLQLDHEMQKMQDNLVNMTAYEIKHAEEWSGNGRLGEWQPTGSEKAHLSTLSTNDRHSRETIIPTIKEQIIELEAAIAERS
jgi:hypothetical protein